MKDQGDLAKPTQSDVARGLGEIFRGQSGLESLEWALAGREYPEFEGRIGELRQLFHLVERSKRLYSMAPELGKKVMEKPFIGVKDGEARKLLAVVLWGRAIYTTEGLVHAVGIKQESEAMISELGTDRISADSYTIDSAFEDILSGKLSFDGQLPKTQS